MDNSTKDFTIIRNDRSYSHINFNPEPLSVLSKRCYPVSVLQPMMKSRSAVF